MGTVEGERQPRPAGQRLLPAGVTPPASGSGSRARIDAALSGLLPERDLTSGERAVFNAEVDAAIREAARTARFGEVAAARGRGCARS